MEGARQGKSVASLLLPGIRSWLPSRNYKEKREGTLGGRPKRCFSRWSGRGGRLRVGRDTQVLEKGPADRPGGPDASTGWGSFQRQRKEGGGKGKQERGFRMK